MSKPKLVITGRWGWAATSPLIYTLQRNLKYAHFGYTKSFSYLKFYYQQDVDGRTLVNDLKLAQQTGQRWARTASTHLIDIHNRLQNGTWQDWDSGEPSTHKMNTARDIEYLKDFPLDHFTKLITGIPTISKYVDFYHALHDHVTSKGYKSVGDGYSLPRVRTNYIKPTEYMDRFYDTIKSEFDVKIIWITRDPVRRAFSNYLREYQKFVDDSLYNLPLQLNFPDYIPRILEFNNRFGKDNVHTVVMEELWEGDGTAVRELSDFLDHPISPSQLWKNLYVPDRGHLIQHDPEVPCQAYGQELQELTPDLYNHYKQKYQYIYDKWVDYFGSLPLYWGQPLNYHTGKPL